QLSRSRLARVPGLAGAHISDAGSCATPVVASERTDLDRLDIPRALRETQYPVAGDFRLTDPGHRARQRIDGVGASVVGPTGRDVCDVTRWAACRGGRGHGYHRVAAPNGDAG